MVKKEMFIHAEWIKLIGKQAYESIKEMIDDEGYILEFEGMLKLKDFPSFGYTGIVDWEKLSRKEDPKIMYMRPEKIRFIEKNNGWICVNNKQDMPTEDCLIRICMESKQSDVIYTWHSDSGLLEANQESIRGTTFSPYKFWLNTVSHYKIYIPEPEPLY